MFINPEKELYPLLRDLIKTMKNHLPSNYHGNFKFEFKFRKGEVYEVADVWGRRTFDLKELTKE